LGNCCLLLGGRFNSIINSFIKAFKDATDKANNTKIICQTQIERYIKKALDKEEKAKPLPTMEQVPLAEVAFERTTLDEIRAPETGVPGDEHSTNEDINLRLSALRRRTPSQIRLEHRDEVLKYIEEHTEEVKKFFRYLMASHLVTFL